MAGGGIRGGQVHGASDRYAAYPVDDPVTPGDVTATIYHCLGMPDQQFGRLLPICSGKPIRGLLA